jgi:hypothetical protein
MCDREIELPNRMQKCKATRLGGNSPQHHQCRPLHNARSLPFSIVLLLPSSAFTRPEELRIASKPGTATFLVPTQMILSFPAAVLTKDCLAPYFEIILAEGCRSGRFCRLFFLAGWTCDFSHWRLCKCYVLQAS